MHMLRSGAGGLTLLFVHGFACDNEDWKQLSEALETQYTVVTVDLPGHGRTPGTREDAHIAAFAREVSALLRQPCVLIGHSMGCRVILEVGRLVPEYVAGLVLIDGSRLGSGNVAEAVQLFRARLGGPRYPAFLESFFAAMFVDALPARAAIMARARRLRPELGEELFLDLVRWDVAELDAALSAVRSPCLAIQSTTIVDGQRTSLRKGESSAWLELLQAAVPDLEVHVIAGRGHFVHIEATDMVSRLIADFCRGLQNNT